MDIIKFTTILHNSKFTTILIFNKFSIVEQYINNASYDETTTWVESGKDDEETNIEYAGYNYKF